MRVLGNSTVHVCLYALCMINALTKQYMYILNKLHVLVSLIFFIPDYVPLNGSPPPCSSCDPSVSVTFTGLGTRLHVDRRG